MEKALHIASHVNGFERRHSIVYRYRTLSGESRSVDPETVGDWKNYITRN
jgi:hypothetical protein